MQIGTGYTARPVLILTIRYKYIYRGPYERS
nr:MAG TPA: hypothetical protein [Caudoviricetes sp.]